jgi:hypothetical protein
MACIYNTLYALVATVGVGTKVDFRGREKGKGIQTKNTLGANLIGFSSNSLGAAASLPSPPPRRHPQKTPGLVADYGAAVADRPWFARPDDTSGYRCTDSFNGDCWALAWRKSSGQTGECSLRRPWRWFSAIVDTSTSFELNRCGSSSCAADATRICCWSPPSYVDAHAASCVASGGSGDTGCRKAVLSH